MEKFRSSRSGGEGWQRLSLGGRRYVGQGRLFEPFDWYLLTAEREDIFYSSVGKIYQRTAVILIASLIIALGLLIVFSNILTKPIKDMVSVIQDIISTGDLSKNVTLWYQDEVGQLGHYFNQMTGELDSAYGQIKKYAYEMALWSTSPRAWRG